MEASTITTIYEADDRTHQRVTDRVIAREKQATRDIERQLQTRRQTAERMTAGLLGRLPGGGRTSQVKDLLDDFKVLSQRADAGANSISGLGLAAEALGGPLGIVAAGLTAGVVAGGLFLKTAWELASWASEYGSQLQDLSQRTGIAVDDLSVWKVAVESSGGSLQSVNTALGQYIRKVADVNHGNKQAAADFKQIGIDAKAAYESPQAAIAALVNRTNQLSNEEDRLLLLRKAGVRNAEQVNAAIEEMGGTYEAFRKKIASAGLIITPAQAKAADEFGDRIKYVELQVKALAFTAGSEFFPPFLQGMDALKDDLAVLGPLTRDWAQITAGGLSLALSMLKPYVDQIAIAIHLLESVPQIQALKSLGAAQAGQARIASDFMAGIDAAGKTVQGALNRGNRLGDKTDRSGGQSAAQRAAQQALELARIDVREAESVYGEANAIARRAFELNLNDFSDYVQRRKDAERDRHAAVLEGFKAERAAAETLPKAGERAVRLKDIGQREADELRKHNETNAQLTTEGLVRRLDIQRKFAESEARLLEQRQTIADADLSRLIAQGTKTHEQAVRERFVALARVAEQQGEALRVGLVRALGGDDAAKELSETIGDLIANAVNAEDVQGIADAYKTILGKAANKDAAREALDAILEFFLRRKQAFQENNRETIDAQGEDLRSWQSYARKLAEITDSILYSQQEIAQLDIDALSGNNFGRNAAIEANRALEVARENARHLREVRDLEARRALEELNQNERERAAIVAGIDAEIEAVHKKHNARLNDIDRRAAEERRQQLVDVANDIADILTAGLEQFDGTWGSIWNGMLNTALDVVRQISSELMKLSFEGLLTGSTQGSSAAGVVGFITNLIGGALTRRFGGGAGSGGGIGGGALSSGAGVIPGRASGGAAFGLTLVGERGPELVNFTSPAHVFSNQDSRKMLSGQGVTNNYYITTPPARGNNYIQKRGSREFAEQIAGTIKTRTRR